ncbi:MAG: shikimate kinase [bacterium]|nr:shikimate kinase [bacterium]
MGLIFITGMTGAGKTVVGEKLAARFGVPFVDADREIERATGKTIAEIFAAGGESEFRDCEAVALSVAADLRDAVIALGAGALMDDQNFELVQESGQLIYLRADVDVLAKRLARAADRPLLRDAHTPAQRKKRLHELLSLREPRYLTADVVIDVDARTPEEIVALLLLRLASS